MTDNATLSKSDLRSDLRRNLAPAEIDRQTSAEQSPQKTPCFSTTYDGGKLTSADTSASPPVLRSEGALSKKSPRSPQGSQGSIKGASRATRLIAYPRLWQAPTASRLGAIWKRERLLAISRPAVRLIPVLLALLAALLARPSHSAALAADHSTSPVRVAGFASFSASRRRFGLPLSWLVVPRAPTILPGARGSHPLQPERKSRA
jgi:hypothetical protein